MRLRRRRPDVRAVADADADAPSREALRPRDRPRRRLPPAAAPSSKVAPATERAHVTHMPRRAGEGRRRGRSWFASEGARPGAPRRAHAEVLLVRGVVRFVPAADLRSVLAD